MSLVLSTLLFCCLLGVMCGILGNFLIARRMSLVGDMLGHAILPGICLGYILSSFEKNLWILFVCALCVALIANYLHEFFSNHQKIKADASLATVLSGFYALGVMLISWINQNSQGTHSGLEHYLLGQASTITQNEGLFIFVLLLFTLFYVSIAFKELRSICFDPLFCQSSWGWKLKANLFLLSTLICAAVIASLQSVGIILSCAYMIIPAACGLFLSQNFSKRLFIGGAIGALSSLCGVLLSYFFSDIPTGPSIILFSTLFFCLSALFGPEGGLIHRRIRQRQKKLAFVLEDLLKSIYYFQEKQNEQVSLSSIMSRMNHFGDEDCTKVLKKALEENLIQQENHHGSLFSLTQKGYGLAAEVVRKHRIWELYLVTKLGFDEQHVHQNAEHAEHFLTPEIVNSIEQLLSSKKIDPHGKTIPSILDLREHGVPGY